MKIDFSLKTFDVSQKSFLSDARLIFKSISHQSMGFNSLVHSLRALSTLRRSGLRTASAAAKPCQEDSLELYLITGNKMANENVPAPAPTRSNDQILPFAAWPWRAILSMINQCLTGKALGFDRPRYPVLQMANMGSPTKKDMKDKPHVIPYCRFMKLIICHLGRIHNIHQRSTSPFHLAEEDLRLEATRPLPVVEGKGKEIETEEQVAQSLLALHTPKIRSITYQLILQRQTPAIEEGSTRPSVQPQDDALTDIVHESLSPVDAEIGADSDKTTSRGDTKTLQIDEDQGKDVDNQVTLEEKTAKLDQGQAGSDLGKTSESRPLPEQEFIGKDQARPDPGVSRVALAGPNPKPTYEEFMATVYLDVHGSLKLPVDGHVPLSSSGTLSSMKNLDDAYTFKD
nr:hypothetical protein [Tanacetum cinerariifolium]